METEFTDQQLSPMKRITFTLPQPKKGTGRNEREVILNDFMEAINREREGTPYKPIKFLGVKQKVAHLNLWQLKDFYKMCSTSKSGFGKCFFGALKIKE